MGNRLLGVARRELIAKQKGRCAYCGSELHHIDIMPDDKNRDPRWACGILRMGKWLVVCRACIPAFRGIAK